MSDMLQKQKTIEVGDTKYVLQMVPASWYLDTVDGCKDDNGNLVNGKYMAEILKNVVASPRRSIDDFTGRIYELRSVVKKAEKFILGEDIKVKEDTPKNANSPEGNE